MKDDLGLTPFTEGMVTSSLLLGAALGAITGGRLSDARGRRRTILTLAVVFFVGALGCTLALNTAIMVVARFVLGLAVGGASVTVPVYLAEISPAERRGAPVGGQRTDDRQRPVAGLHLQRRHRPGGRRVRRRLALHARAGHPAYTSQMAAQDTAVHEIDVLRWLLDDEIVSAQVITPRATSKRFDHLKDPQLMYFETANGVRIDLEVFVNRQYGYDIQCETVGEEGLVRLSDPATVGVRTAGRHGTAVLQDWKGSWTPSTPSSVNGSPPSGPVPNPPGRPHGTATPPPSSPTPP